MRRSNQHRNEFQVLSLERSVSIFQGWPPSLHLQHWKLPMVLSVDIPTVYPGAVLRAQVDRRRNNTLSGSIPRLNLETAVGCPQFDRDSTGPQMGLLICGLGAPYTEYVAPIKSDSTGVSLQGSWALKLYTTMQTVLPFTIVGFLNKCCLPELTEKQKQKTKKKKRQH